jgi:hypothetical protein
MYTSAETFRAAEVDLWTVKLVRELVLTSRIDRHLFFVARCYKRFSEAADHSLDQRYENHSQAVSAVCDPASVSFEMLKSGPRLCLQSQKEND